jgi:hypothetical protein
LALNCKGIALKGCLARTVPWWLESTMVAVGGALAATSGADQALAAVCGHDTIVRWPRPVITFL